MTVTHTRSLSIALPVIVKIGGAYGAVNQNTPGQSSSKGGANVTLAEYELVNNNLKEKCSIHLPLFSKIDMLQCKIGLLMISA